MGGTSGEQEALYGSGARVPWAVSLKVHLSSQEAEDPSVGGQQEGGVVLLLGPRLAAGRVRAEASLLRRGGWEAAAGTSAAPAPVLFYFLSQSLNRSGLQTSCWLSTEHSL